MQKIVLVEALTTFSSTICGNVGSGDRIALSESYAKHLADAKLVELVKEVSAADDTSPVRKTTKGTKRARAKKSPTS
jgi:hypothetical protein